MGPSARPSATIDPELPDVDKYFTKGRTYTTLEFFFVGKHDLSGQILQLALALAKSRSRKYMDHFDPALQSAAGKVSTLQPFMLL